MLAPMLALVVLVLVLVVLVLLLLLVVVLVLLVLLLLLPLPPTLRCRCRHALGRQLAKQLGDEQGDGSYAAQSRKHLLKPRGHKRPRHRESRVEHCAEPLVKIHGREARGDDD